MPQLKSCTIDESEDNKSWKSPGHRGRHTHFITGAVHTLWRGQGSASPGFLFQEGAAARMTEIHGSSRPCSAPPKRPASAKGVPQIAGIQGLDIDARGGGGDVRHAARPHSAKPPVQRGWSASSSRGMSGTQGSHFFSPIKEVWMMLMLFITLNSLPLFLSPYFPTAILLVSQISTATSCTALAPQLSSSLTHHHRAKKYNPLLMRQVPGSLENSMHSDGGADIQSGASSARTDPTPRVDEPPVFLPSWTPQIAAQKGQPLRTGGTDSMGPTPRVDVSGNPKFNLQSYLRAYTNLKPPLWQVW